jgi:hypothetical protein
MLIACIWYSVSLWGREETNPFNLERDIRPTLHVCRISNIPSVGIASYATNALRRDTTIRAEFLY